MANANNLSSMVQEPIAASFNSIGNEMVVTTLQSTVMIRDGDPGEGFDHVDRRVCVPTLRMHPPTGAPKKRPRSPEEKPIFTQGQLDNPLFSDEEDTTYIPPPKDGTLMLKCARSIILSRLPREVKTSMEGTVSTEITHQLAKKKLGLSPHRWKHVTDTKPVGSLRLSDSLGHMHLFWPTPPLSDQLLSTERSLALMLEVAGEIRDQDDHAMCCFYALCDLISSTAVLHGQMDRYKPLSQMYVCQHVYEEEYAKKKGNHNCYLCDFYSALKFAKESKGIPLATEAEKSDTFDCGVKRVIAVNEKRYRIKEVYKYETLQQALVRLKTHTVAATLLCYDGWEDAGLYTGPRENASMVGEHEVLMLACIQHEGKIAIQCKSSNGRDLGNDGYIYVSTEVMFIEVASSRKHKHQSTCMIKPSYLLYDFYSIDMDDGVCGVKFSNKLFKKQEQENMNFKVKFQDAHGRRRRRGISSLQSAGRYIKPNCGVVFEPFEKVKKELDLVPSSPQLSLARHLYSPECEAAVNEQINVEYNVSYVYHALYAYFDRDNVALKGLAKFFKDSSVEERDHAEMLMEYQNKRGGRVKLQPMVMPQSEFDHAEKGDALYAMELALSLEKLLNVHSVASKNDDLALYSPSSATPYSLTDKPFPPPISQQRERERFIHTKMLLKSASAFSLVNIHGAKKDISPLFSSSSSSLSLLPVTSGKSRNLSFSVSASTQTLRGVVFEPFEEVKKELDLVPSSPQLSLARHLYSPECEAAVNEQINVEYNVSYVYHALYAYFDRDNVALKGLAKFFKDSSVEERDHAEMLMEYQNKRGGRVKLQPMVMPQSEFDHAEKGDALYAMELALSLEKLLNEKLLNVHSVASKNDDVQLADFTESEFLNEQVEAIKKISEYVAQLRRLGKGHGTWHFDQELLEAAAA